MSVLNVEIFIFGVGKRFSLVVGARKRKRDGFSCLLLGFDEPTLFSCQENASKTKSIN
jgi:hypothetical protein